MLDTCPFEKLADKNSEYVYDKCGRNLMEMWQSKIFGGNVLKPMSRKNGTAIPNCLK